MKGFVDANLILSDSQAVLGVDLPSTNAVGLPEALLGEGHPLYLHIAVDVAFAGGTNINFELQDAPDNGSGAPGTFAAMGIEKTVLTAALTANTEIWRVALPSDTRQWVRVLYDVTGTMTAGTIDAWISDH
jgi:hypothetical protein